MGRGEGGIFSGATHLYFKDLLNTDGTLLPYADLIEKLASLGITPSQPIVVYCTGGIPFRLAHDGAGELGI